MLTKSWRSAWQEQAWKAAVGMVLLSLLAAATVQAQATHPEFLVMGIHPHALIVLDTSRDEVVAEIQTHGRSPKEIECSRDGKRLYVTTEGRSQIEIVDFVNRKVEDVIHLAPPGYKYVIYGTALSRDGKELYVHVKPVRELSDAYQAETPEILALDVTTHKIRKVAEVPEGVGALAALGDGKRLLAWGRDLYFVDIAQGKITDTYPLETPSPDHSPLDSLPLFVQYDQTSIFSVPYYTTSPANGSSVMGLVNVDVESGKVNLVELGPAVPLFSAVLSPDRKRAYAVMNHLVVVDLEKQRVTNVLNLDRTKYVVNISHDGRKLYVSGAGPFMDIYDTQSLKQIKKIELSGDGSVTSLRVVPHGAAP
jgi:DNA-binding beta-propeller fold protein YncE